MPTQAMNKPSRREGGGHGMNWIRKERRLAIYLRDGLSCAWCCQTIEDGAKLTLDHIVPYSEGGTTKSDNLIVACLRCNSSRGSRSIETFAASVAGYLNHGVNPADILKHINTTRYRVVDTKAAKALIARRGGFTAACRKETR
jgi:hypothetical protein